MPWQAHLFIGERVHNFDEVRAIFKKLDPIIELPAEDDKYEFFEIQIPFSLTLLGKEYKSSCYLFIESEGGNEFPERTRCDNTGAMVCIPLTSRYAPSILDRSHAYGRPDPFEINLEEATELLNQVRGDGWSDAQLLLCDVFH